MLVLLYSQCNVMPPSSTRVGLQDIWMPVARGDGVENDWVQFGKHHTGCSCDWPCEVEHTGVYRPLQPVLHISITSCHVRFFGDLQV